MWKQRIDEKKKEKCQKSKIEIPSISTLFMYSYYREIVYVCMCVYKRIRENKRKCAWNH